MTFAGWDHYEWKLGRQRAVELLAQQIAYAELEKQETITLPAHAANVVYTCAKAGARKGQGRGSAMTTRRHAVETLRQQIVNEGEITLPLHTAKIILSCARDGRHKGQGRRRPPDSEGDRIAKRTVTTLIGERAAELVAKGMKPSRAKEKAAEEAQAGYGKRIGRSAGYMKRKAFSKS